MKKLFFMLICVLITGINAMANQVSSGPVIISVESNLEKTNRTLHIWNQSDEIMHVFTCAGILVCNGMIIESPCQDNKPIAGVDIIKNDNGSTTYKDSYFKKLSTYQHNELAPDEKTEIKSDTCFGATSYKWHSISHYCNEPAWEAFKSEFIKQNPDWKP